MARSSGGSDEIKVPIYLDASAMDRSRGQRDAMIRDLMAQSARPGKSVVGEVYREGVRGNDKLIGEVKAGENLTNAKMYLREQILRRAELYALEGKISRDSYQDIVRMSRLTNQNAKTRQDLNEELSKAVHVQRKANVIERNRNRASQNRPLTEAETVQQNLDRIEERYNRNLERARQRVDRRRAADERRSAADTRSAAMDRERRTSQRMMGIGGVATALSMPISGFTPLTIGFASMSGVQYGFAAAGAVAIRAMYDIKAGLDAFQEKLKDVAISAGAVSIRFRKLEAAQKGRNIAQGVLVTEQAADRMQDWSDLIKKNAAAVALSNEAYGVFRRDLSMIGATAASFITGASEKNPFGKRTNYQRMGGGAGLLGGVVGFGAGVLYGGRAFDEGMENFASRGPAIQEALNNMKRGKGFQASFLGPEQMYDRLAIAGASRKDKEEEMLKLQRDQLVALKKIAEEAAKTEEKSAGRDAAKSEFNRTLFVP